jgi:hypothetical protein
MAEPFDSPYVISRWHEVSRETEKLLRQNEALMEERMALCRRRADLFRELLHMTRTFVDDVASSTSHFKDHRRAGTSTGTVESSPRKRYRRITST